MFEKKKTERPLQAPARCQAQELRRQESREPASGSSPRGGGAGETVPARLPGPGETDRIVLPLQTGMGTGNERFLNTHHASNAFPELFSYLEGKGSSGGLNPTPILPIRKLRFRGITPPFYRLANGSSEESDRVPQTSPVNARLIRGPRTPELGELLPGHARSGKHWSAGTRPGPELRQVRELFQALVSAPYGTWPASPKTRFKELRVPGTVTARETREFHFCFPWGAKASGSSVAPSRAGRSCPGPRAGCFPSWF